MKFPSLVKLPKYNKFNFEPRYYDPVKEEIDVRTGRIKQEIEAQEAAGLTASDRARFKSEMDSVFKRRADEDRKSGIMQVVFILLFFSIFVGYLFYGNNVIYAALILIPAYIFYRRRQFISKK